MADDTRARMVNLHRDARRARLFERAARVRRKQLEELQLVVTLCTCTWPVETARSGHGHGKSQDGEPCPAGRHLAVQIEDEEDD